MASSEVANCLELCGFRQSVAGPDFAGVVAAYMAAQARGRGILLAGVTGCGKSLAMRCLYPPSAPPRRDCRWIDCFDPVQVGWLEDHDIWTWAKTIVLDDLGAERDSNDYGVRLLPIADFFMRASRRHDNGEFVPRVCVTTNMSARQMSERYGDRMLSRLLAVTEPVQMSGSDKRSEVPA